jgi:hypothetical protein
MRAVVVPYLYSITGELIPQPTAVAVSPAEKVSMKGVSMPHTDAGLLHATSEQVQSGKRVNYNVVYNVEQGLKEYRVGDRGGQGRGE